MVFIARDRSKKNSKMQDRWYFVRISYHKLCIKFHLIIATHICYLHNFQMRLLFLTTNTIIIATYIIKLII